MADRWNIHKGDQVLGPFTAQDIRAGMRDGRFSPFDLASKEGGQLKRPLVETDEIFDRPIEATPSPGNPPQSALSLSNSDTPAPSIPQEIFQPAISVIGPVPTASPPSPSPPSPTPFNPQVTAPSPAPPAAENNGWRPLATRVFHDNTPPPPVKVPDPTREQAKSIKGFFLENRQGFTLGPLTASEIMKMYYQKTIAPPMMVGKYGITKKITLEKFISMHTPKTGASPKTRLPRKSAAATLRQFHSIASARLRIPSSNLNLALLGAGAAGIILVAFILGLMLAKKPAPATHAQGSAPVPTPVVQAAQEDSWPTIDPSRYAPSKSAKKTHPRATPPQKSRPKKSTPPPARTAPRAYSARMPSIPTPPPVAPPPRSSGTSRIGLIKDLTSLEGQVATIGPLSFNPSVLESCKLKCQLPMTDSAGGSLVAVFFKGAFLKDLMASNGRAVVTGTVRHEGTCFLYLKK